MHINYFIFPFILILGFLLGNYNNRRNRLIFISIVTFVLMLQSTLRGLSVGSDTASYYWMFHKVREMPWRTVLDNFVERYRYFNSEDDAGYLVMQKLIGTFSESWQIFVFLAQLTFFIPLGRLMYKYSTSMLQLVFAYVLYVALFHIIALSGGRQLYSIGFTILAFIYLSEEKYKNAVFYTIIGSLLHLSSLLFLLPVILIRFKPINIKILHLITFIFLPFVLVNANEFITFMGSSIGIERYAAYGSGTLVGGAFTFIFLLVVSSVFIYVIFDKNDLIHNKKLYNLYSMVPLFTFFGPLIHSNGSMIRVSMYFHLYLMLLLPFAIDKYFKGHNRIKVYLVVMGLIFFLALKGGGLVYYFFWNDPEYRF